MKWRCSECGYRGRKFVFRPVTFTCAIARPENGSSLISFAPDWNKTKYDEELAKCRSILCPKCLAGASSIFPQVSSPKNPAFAPKIRSV